jgi:polyvinyl alcohol dehydrogenase (cytochrome)
MLAHDLSSSYHNPSEKVLSPANVGGLGQSWSLEVSGPVTGAPAVVGDVVYTMSSGATYALDARSGRILWQNSLVGGTSSPTYSDGMLFLNAANSVVHALDAATGEERWSAVIDPHPAAAGYSSPVVVDRFVIVGSASIEEALVSEGATFRGGVVAFDRSSGAELWRFYTADPPFNGCAVWSTVSVDLQAGLVFASTGNTYTGPESAPLSDAIFALDLTTGALRWAHQLTSGDIFTIPNPKSPDTDFGTNPILFEATIDGKPRKLLGAGQKSGVFWVLDRENGDVVWNRRVSPGSPLTGGMLNNGGYDGKRLIAVGNNGTSNAPGSEPSNNSSGPGATSLLIAMNPADGAVLWERQLPSWVWAPITTAGSVGFVAVDTMLEAFDTETGGKLFSFQTGGTIASAPSVSGGHVYFGSGLAYFVGTRDQTVHALGLGGAVPTPVPTATPGGPGAPGFSAIFDEIVVGQGCNTTSCHGSNQGNLSMTSRDEAYANLVGVKAAGPLCGGSGLIRVVPGDPDHSLLLDKISHLQPACGGPMPPTGQLSAQEIEQVRLWIEMGAAND